MPRPAVVLVALAAALAAGCSDQSNIESSVRAEMKTQLGVAIQSLALTKQPDGGYAGTATADNGDTYDVTVTAPTGIDRRYEWKALPGQAMIDRIVRQGIEQQLHSKVAALQLTKGGGGLYSGTATLETGGRVAVKTRMQGNQVLWEAEPVGP